MLAVWLAAPACWAADCGSQDLNQMQLTECANQAAKQADAELNRVYGALQGKIEPAAQQRLRDAQRAWIAFRDKECLFRTNGGADQPGSIWPMEVLDCTADLTRARIKDLKRQLACQSWDLSCPAK